MVNLSAMFPPTHTTAPVLHLVDPRAPPPSRTRHASQPPPLKDPSDRKCHREKVLITLPTCGVTRPIPQSDPCLLPTSLLTKHVPGNEAIPVSRAVCQPLPRATKCFFSTQTLQIIHLFCSTPTKTCEFSWVMAPLISRVPHGQAWESTWRCTSSFRRLFSTFFCVHHSSFTFCL